jgi:hypothetical protein
VTLADHITVLVPTSPIPSHPSTAIIDETLASLTAAGLQGCPVIVMADGVRPEQEDRAAAYKAYLLELRRVRREGECISVQLHAEHRHQAALTHDALASLVRTPLILFVEHDTPLCGEIPWLSMVAAISSGDADVIRLHHEAAVLDPHRYLMCGRRRDVHGVPLVGTAQWSQRPHLASTEWYRWMLSEFFPPHARTMIEDRLYSEIATPWIERHEWGKVCKLWMYAPWEGTWKRSEHLDGRGTDPKYGMTW